MVLVFDMDDTLYDERTFVRSGFGAVAELLAPVCGCSRAALLRQAMDLLDRQGRGRVFDELLRAHGRPSRSLVERCLQTYRTHAPDIALWPEAARCLRRHARLPLYVVTDGNVAAQANKARALGLYDSTKRVLLTHRFGLRHAKPSPYCFERIAAWERVRPEQVVYVADDPAKDFVGIRRLGFRTIRVLTGRHAAVKAKPGYDAERTIDSLAELDLSP
jgi:putative hydrolase of the HAD superfamily